MYNTRDIANELDCPPRTVTRICQRLGYDKVGRDWVLTLEQVQEVKENYHGRAGNPNFGRVK